MGEQRITPAALAAYREQISTLRELQNGYALEFDIETSLLRRIREQSRARKSVEAIVCNPDTLVMFRRSILQNGDGVFRGANLFFYLPDPNDLINSRQAVLPLGRNYENGATEVIPGIEEHEYGLVEQRLQDLESYRDRGILPGLAENCIRIVPFEPDIGLAAQA